MASQRDAGVAKTKQQPSPRPFIIRWCVRTRQENICAHCSMPAVSFLWSEIPKNVPEFTVVATPAIVMTCELVTQSLRGAIATKSKFFFIIVQQFIAIVLKTSWSKIPWHGLSESRKHQQSSYVQRKRLATTSERQNKVS